MTNFGYTEFMNDESKADMEGFDSPEIRGARLTAQKALEQRAQKFIARHDSTIDRLYDEHLNRETRKEAPVISLDSIPVDVRDKRLQQLHQKLDEYTDRFKAAQMRPQRFRTPANLDTLHKRDVLRLVLERGSVNTWAYSNAVREQLKVTLTRGIFENSCFVVDDYIKTGGTNLISGGLP